MAQKINDRINTISLYLDELYPNVGCELIYKKDYELAIAVMLSAQATDISVNKVTKVLFEKYNTLEALDSAPLFDIENIIRSIGLYKNKAKNLKSIVHELLTRFNGKLPSDKKELTSLPGIGNKTAGVIRAEIFKIPELPVDTHVSRVSKRLSLAKDADNPDQIEVKLKKLFPVERHIKTHHQLIHFGRYFCLAKNPHCGECRLKEICKNRD